MILLKKLFFGLLFLIAFTSLIYQLIPLLNSYDFIFALSASNLIQLIIIAGLVFASSLLFCIFVAVASDWQLTLAIGTLASLSPLLFLDTARAGVLIAGILVSILLTYLSLDNALKSYLNFQPSNLLGPSIKRLSGLLILILCLVYFLSVNKVITQKGFQIPDSLIDTALKMTPMNLPTEQNQTPVQLPTISPEQIELLKQNPDLLRQSGLDPKILDSLNNPSEMTLAPQQLSQDLIKQTVKDQIQGFIKPYINFVPAGLAAILFLTLQSFVSVVSILSYPLLWLIFSILEGTGFIKFETEMKEVKKLVV